MLKDRIGKKQTHKYVKTSLNDKTVIEPKKEMYQLEM